KKRLDQRDGLAWLEGEIKRGCEIDHDIGNLRRHRAFIGGARQSDRRSEKMLGFVERIDPETFLAGQGEIANRLLPVVGLRIVMRQRLDVLVDAAGAAPLDLLRDAK